jgi:hypothetical protein
MDTQPEGAEQVDYSMEEDYQPLASESHKFMTREESSMEVIHCNM